MVLQLLVLHGIEMMIISIFLSTTPTLSNSIHLNVSVNGPSVVLAEDVRVKIVARIQIMQRRLQSH
jgi:hypothetical protein